MEPLPPNPDRRCAAVLVAVVTSVWACLPQASAESAYRETFPEHRNPEQFLRIAQAGEKWEILEDEDGVKFLRVTFEPTTERRRGLVVWDLVPVSFRQLSLQVRANDTGGAPVFLSLSASDRFGTSYAFEPFGKSADRKRAPIPSDGSWGAYTLRTPDNLEQVFARGAEVSPFVHGRGDAVERWEAIDFSNIGYKTLHFHVDAPPNSRLLGKSFTVDFKLLDLASGE